MLPYLKKKTVPLKKKGLKLFPNKYPFDPHNSPGFIFDGDIGLDALQWFDVPSIEKINFFNLPFYNPIGLNGHGTILFDGIIQYGNNATIVLPQPFTAYFVLRQVTWTNNRMFWTSIPNFFLRQKTASPNLLYTNDFDEINTNELLLNTWNVITCLQSTGNSGIRIGLNPINLIPFDFGAAGLNGIRLAFDNLINFGNVEFAYIVLRPVADPVWIQNNFINYFKNRFAI